MIWEETLAYMKRNQFVRCELYGPIYLCAVGAHIANYHNKAIPERRAFYTHMGDVPDLRLHLFAVAPPGYGKTLYIRFFTGKKFGILRDAIPVLNQQALTNKGLIGGFDAQEERIIGDAEMYADAIYGVDEFDHIVKAASSDHSSDLENSLLDLLDSGQVRYRPGTHSALEYDSYITMLCGTQPERFSVSSGITRRLTFVDMSPDESVTKALSLAYDEGANIQPDMDTLRVIRGELKWAWKNLNINQIIFTPEYREARNKIAADHIEKAYLDKFAIGYRLIRYYRGEPELIMMMDNDLYKLMLSLREMKIMCLSGANDSAVLKLIGEKTWTLTELKQTMVARLSINYQSGDTILNSLLRRKLIQGWKETKPGSKKPTSFISKTPDDILKECGYEL